MKIKITKIQELPNALHPNNILEGWTKTCEVDMFTFEPPKVGYRFNCGGFSSSGIQELIDNYTFRTYSSIYRWEIIKDEENKEIPKEG